MKNKRTLWEKVRNTLATTTAIGAFGATCILPQKYTAIDTYRGFHTADGDTTLVFDDYHKDKRVGQINLAIDGSSKDLKIGEKYKVMYDKPLFDALSLKKLTGIEKI